MALAALSGVSACSFVDSLFVPAPAEPAVSQPPPAQSSPPLARPAAAAPAPARTARLPLPPTPAPGRDADGRDTDIRLVGLSRAEAQALLGPPAGESERSPAKVWQYVTADCAIDVYFYLDVARNDFYALHYEARAPLASAGGSALNGTPTAEWCLRRVHDARRPR